jgi:hypothetical protein
MAIQIVEGVRLVQSKCARLRVRPAARLLKALPRGTAFVVLGPGALPAAEGLQNAGSCYGAVVFVDESAESVVTFDLAGGR